MLDELVGARFGAEAAGRVTPPSSPVPRVSVTASRKRSRVSLGEQYVELRDAGHEFLLFEDADVAQGQGQGQGQGKGAGVACPA